MSALNYAAEYDTFNKARIVERAEDAVASDWEHILKILKKRLSAKV